MQPLHRGAHADLDMVAYGVVQHMYQLRAPQRDPVHLGQQLAVVHAQDVAAPPVAVGVCAHVGVSDGFEIGHQPHAPGGAQAIRPLIAPYFALLAKMARELGLTKLSMGMSEDYEVAAMLGASLENLIIAIAITEIAPFVRVARAPTIALKQRDFVEAGRALGYGPFRLMGVHILPNMISDVVVLGG